MLSGKKRYIIIKLALLGNPAVGKTSLIKMYAQHFFEEDYKPTLGVNVVLKEINLEKSNAHIKLAIWDIAGQETYDFSRKMFFQGVQGALIVYDKTRHKTFENIESKWLGDLKKFGDSNSTFLLIGNKIDLQNSIEVSTEKGKQLAEKIKATKFIETSAKYGNNVEDAFKSLIEPILTNIGIIQSFS